MTKLLSISLAALTLAIGATASQARPTAQAIAEVRAKMAAKVTTGRYMRLDATTPDGCSGSIDAGENRFDRMYDSFGTSGCTFGR